MSITVATLVALSISSSADIPECVISPKNVTILVDGQTEEALAKVRNNLNSKAYFCKKTTNYLRVWETVDYLIWAGQYKTFSSREERDVREALFPYDVYIITPKKKAVGY